MQILIFELVLVVFLIIITAAVILDVDLFACTLLFCVFSFCAVLTYLFFGSPDVAFTEAVIGTMSTVFFAVALKKVDRKTRHDRRPILAWLERRKLLKELKEGELDEYAPEFDPAEHKKISRRARDRVLRIITLIMMAGICLAFCMTTKYLPAIGDATSAPNTHVSDYYIEHSEEDTASPNIVSGTLADYRGYDTMFETSVMFVSGLVVTLILASGKSKFNPLEDARRRRREEKAEKAVKADSGKEEKA